MKVCKECNEEKELTLFDKISKNSYRNTCRKCRNTKNRNSYLLKEGNLEKRREYQREYQKKHREDNDYYKIYCKCLEKNRQELDKIKNNSNKLNIELKQHIEKLFTIDMSWENHGTYWELDHIISATKMAKLGFTIDEINKITNLRPLEIKENRERCKKQNDEYKLSYSNSNYDYMKKYQEENKERLKEYRKEYYKSKKNT